MNNTLELGRFRLTIIADNRDQFRSFAPYVASINRHGTIAFQATLRDGSSGVFTGNGAGRATSALLGSINNDEHYSHPDINAAGSLCVYARSSGVERVIGIVNARSCTINETGTGSFSRIGPLGPTMNDAGMVAFRADTHDGPGIFVSGGQSAFAIASVDKTAQGFCAFHGLPVINRAGNVLFRADRCDGVQGIYLYRGRGEPIQTVADTSGDFRDLGLFPCLDDAGAVTFTAAHGGVSGLFRLLNAHVTTLVDTLGAFEKMRGGLANDRGTLVVYATPHSGTLGIYSGYGSDLERVIGLGDTLFGSRVTDLALNPVSLNEVGQFALRLAFANGTQLIARVDNRQ